MQTWSMRHQIGDHQWIGCLWGGCSYKLLVGTHHAMLGQGRAVHFSSAFIHSASLAVVLKLIGKVVQCPWILENSTYVHRLRSTQKKGKLDISFSCKHDFISGVNRRIV